MQDFYKVYADQKVKEATAEKDEVIKEKDNQIDNSVIAILEEGTFNDEKIKKIFNITDERLAEIKAKIKD